MKHKKEKEELTREIIMKQLGTTEEELKGIRTKPTLKQLDEFLMSISPWFRKYYSETNEILSGIDDCWPEEPKNSELKQLFEDQKPLAQIASLDAKEARVTIWWAYILWLDSLDEEDVKKIII